MASLGKFRTLQLDLTGLTSRPNKAVDGFFRHAGALSSGVNTLSSVRSRNSGMFSGEDIEFTEIKKSMKESKQHPAEERAPIVGAFVPLGVLHLIGEPSLRSSAASIVL